MKNELVIIRPGDRVLLGVNLGEEDLWPEAEKLLVKQFPNVEFTPVFGAWPDIRVLWVYRDADHPYVTPQTDRVGITEL